MAIHKYVMKTQDKNFLNTVINGTSIINRLENALIWLTNNRTDSETGLLFGGTTIDWGDVQPEANVPDGRLLAENSHPSIGIYANSLFVMAIDAFIELS